MSYCASEFYGITDASEARESARLDAEWDDLQAAQRAADLDAERIACAAAEAEEDAQIAAQANPVTAALDFWVKGQSAARPRALDTIYAEIANGLFVRVGTGKKTRRAA